MLGTATSDFWIRRGVSALKSPLQELQGSEAFLIATEVGRGAKKRTQPVMAGRSSGGLTYVGGAFARPAWGSMTAATFVRHYRQAFILTISPSGAGAQQCACRTMVWKRRSIRRHSWSVHQRVVAAEPGRSKPLLASKLSKKIPQFM
jgi:hypothetical protein